MKFPILLERAFKGFRTRKVNLDWVKYVIFVIAIIVTVFSLIFYIVDSTMQNNEWKNKVCAVSYGSPEWEHETHDTNPDDNNAHVIDRCINKKNNNEVKDYPKDAPDKPGMSITVEKAK
jgi:hypothetical protein